MNFATPPRGILPLFALLLGTFYAHAAAEEQAVARIIDVGAGLCCVISVPSPSGPRFIIYDTGNYTGNGSQSFEEITKFIPVGSQVDLLILSHSDADHLGATDEVIDAYDVKKIVHSGRSRPTGTYRAAIEAIEHERIHHGAQEINLADTELLPGSTFRIGNGFATLVCGFSSPPPAWGSFDEAEANNAGSIVLRFVYGGKSIIFCGDAVGREIGAPVDECIASEKFMVDMSPAVTLRSDVIVAPHHGADNASSTPFIKAVAPSYVIFSSGHKFHHPRRDAAQRYLDCGVPVAHLFRTDRGDDEGGTEWDHGREAGAKDQAGDDSVNVTISAAGVLKVSYLNP